MAEWGVSTRDGGSDTTTVKGREARRGCSVGSTTGVDSGEGRLKLVFCCNVRGKPMELGLLGEQRAKQ